MPTLTPRSLIRGAAIPAAMALAATAPQAAAHTGQTLLTCTVSTTSGKPITLDPPVRLVAQRVTARATLALSQCTSPTGAHARLRSGWLTAHGTGQASCVSVSDINAGGRITWYDADKRQAGTSVLNPDTVRTGTVKSYNPGNLLLSGKVTKGRLTGATVTGNAVPTSDVSACATTGLTSVAGAGKVTFTV
ncbi:hypothetical protein [Nonomuraea insulae]|uniref:Secreted protein n=1 Tax=Nonomuraea insulae TaxID=1616787 RepID=A0ABW1DFQ0_9ACTN